MASTFPHVTITVAGKENGADASGELNTLSLGYGFHQAWIYSAMFSAGVFFGTDTPFTMLFDGAYSCSLIVLVISMIFFGIALLALGVTNQMFLRFYVSKRALGLSALLTCLGTYASFLVPVGGPLGTLALLFAGLATGIGSSLMVVLWGTAFARYEFSTIILNTAVSVAIGIGLYMVLTHLVPPFCSGIITGIFPGLMLWPINAILGDYNAGSLVVGLSGLQEGPGAWNATGLSVMMAIAAAAGWYFVRRFVVLREVDVHTCGLPTEVATSRMAPSGIYGGLVRRLAWFPGNTSVDNKS